MEVELENFGAVVPKAIINVPAVVTIIDGRPTKEIVLSEPWSEPFTITGGSGNFTIEQLRLPHNIDPLDGFNQSDLELLAADDLVVYGNGNTKNEKWWTLRVTDNVSGAVTGPVSGSRDGFFYLNITNYDPEDPDTPPESEVEYLLAGSVVVSGTGSGAGGQYIENDVVTVTFEGRNAKDGPLTGVTISNQDPNNTLTGANSVSLSNIGDTTQWSMTLQVSAADVSTGSVSVSADITSIETSPAVVSLSRTFSVGETALSVPVEIWCEDRNYDQVPADSGVQPILGGPIPWSGAHIQGYALNHPQINGDTTNPLWIKNVLDRVIAFNHKVWLHLNSSGDYGWDFSTLRGNYNHANHIASIQRFTAANDPDGNAAIIAAKASGHLKGLQIIDEPFHERWDPQWNGKVGAAAEGSKNKVTNVMLDNVAAECKNMFGSDIKTAIRGGAINLGISRGGLYQFQHLTHAMLTANSKRWGGTANKGANKGFEWYYTLKRNFFNTSEWEAFGAQNLEIILFIQAGTGRSNVNPWTAAANSEWENIWWNNNIRYPVPGTGHKPYIKVSPWVMDFEIKSLLSPRHATTGELLPADQGGVVRPESVIIFRYDRLPSDSQFMPFSDVSYYTQGMIETINDLSAGILTPRCGVPVGWQGDMSQLNLPPTGTI